MRSDGRRSREKRRKKKITDKKKRQNEEEEEDLQRRVANDAGSESFKVADRREKKKDGQCWCGTDGESRRSGRVGMNSKWPKRRARGEKSNERPPRWKSKAFGQQRRLDAIR